MEYPMLINDIKQTAPRVGKLFPGFEERYIATSMGNIFCRMGGNGPPVLFLHGYPQTSAMWHHVAIEFANSYSVICPDLRGYGKSDKPETDAHHTPYSKREMAKDMVEVMNAIGHEQFLIVSHDRGARVAHRLAMDHQDSVLGIVILDIAPTREMYQYGDSHFAQDYWHWYWLTQPAPLPETLISRDPDYYWEQKVAPGSKKLSIFNWEALSEYLETFRDPKAIHSSCEDYRAAWTIDIEHDNADAHQYGDDKVKAPILTLWGREGAIEKHFDCLKLWQMRAHNVIGEAMPGGHYLAEEHPELIIEKTHSFFKQISNKFIS